MNFYVNYAIDFFAINKIENVDLGQGSSKEKREWLCPIKIVALVIKGHYLKARQSQSWEFLYAVRILLSALSLIAKAGSEWVVVSKWWFRRTFWSLFRTLKNAPWIMTNRFSFTIFGFINFSFFGTVSSCLLVIISLSIISFRCLWTCLESHRTWYK